jgi:hypothetical protein
LPGFLNRASQRSWLMHGIGVGKQQPLASSDCLSRIHGVVLPGPAGGRRAAVDDSQRGKRLGDLSSTVSRIIVDNDDFEVYPLLRRERLQAGAQASFFVTGRHDDRHGWLARDCL